MKYSLCDLQQLPLSERLEMIESIIADMAYYRAGAGSVSNPADSLPRMSERHHPCSASVTVAAGL